MIMDVVIVTKDRYNLLPKAVFQAKNLTDNVIVVDSTEHADIPLLKSLKVNFILTPNAKLGYARQKGLLKTVTDQVAFLDDDIHVNAQWLTQSLKQLTNAKTAAVSPLIIFHDPKHPELAQLSLCGRSAGASSGAVILDRNKVLSVNGWNVDVHFGEDFELAMRLRKHGFEWKRNINIYALHPITYSEWLYRGYTHGYGLASLNTVSPFYLFLRAFGSTIIMPFFYFLRSKSVKVFKAYFLFRLNFLLGLMEAMKQHVA